MKIAALTHELAYYKRLRFGNASEVLVGEQRKLIGKPSIWLWRAPRKRSKVKRPPSSEANAPCASRCLRTSNASAPPCASNARAGEHDAVLVNIGEDVSEQLDVEPAFFFVHYFRSHYASIAGDFH